MATIFVFGSNLAGRHGAGAALEAKNNWGAVYGVGVGRMFNCYAIPTKDENLNVLPLTEIKKYVDDFLSHARSRRHDSFIVTGIGTGHAGYKPNQIAPLFKDVPENVFISGKLYNENPPLVGRP